jgi:hypothetical protein
MIKVSTFLRECLNEIEMKKYLLPCERAITSFLPRSSESLYSMDGTCTTPHALAGIEMFQGNFFIFYFLFLFIFKKFQKNFNPPLPRRSRRARQLLRGGEGIGTQQSHQPTHVIELNSSIGILLPSYSREIRNGGLATCQSNPPPDGAVVYDGIHEEGGIMDRGSIHTWSAST